MEPNNDAKEIGGSAASDAHGNQTNHGRTSFSTGSTTQGGSNHGQGSHDIGGSPYRQGSEGTHSSNIEPLNGSGPVGDAVDSGTSFSGAVDASTGAGAVGDSYGRQGLPAAEGDDAGGQEPQNLVDDSKRNGQTREDIPDGQEHATRQK